MIFLFERFMSRSSRMKTDEIYISQSMEGFILAVDPPEHPNKKLTACSGGFTTKSKLCKSLTQYLR